VIALVQMDESTHELPSPVRLPGLDPARAYRITRIDPHDTTTPVHPRHVVALPAVSISGDVLARVGISVRPQQPQTVVLLEITADNGAPT
jgi:alpha-galactosidase